VDVAVWGVPEELEVEETHEGGAQLKQLKANVPLSFGGLSLRFLDGEGKLVAEMSGSGEPSLRVDLPSRFVADAPPGLVLARYEPGLFPPESAEVEWALNAQVRLASGEPRPLTATWRTKVEPRWRLAAGQTWAEPGKAAQKSP
jgi:hypothetical protein